MPLSPKFLLTLASVAGLLPSPAHAASSFREVREILARGSKEHLSTPEDWKDVTLESVGYQAVKSLDPRRWVEQKSDKLIQRSRQTLRDRSDYDERGFEKIIHPNGICFTGRWEPVSNRAGYTGFLDGSKAGLVVARASVTTGKTRRGQKRGFGLAVKLFPTRDPDQAVDTANFHVIESLNGTRKALYEDAVLTNMPATGVPDSAVELLTFAVTAGSLAVSDQAPTWRPLSPLARAGGC
jgi:hypothetical protein